MGKTIWFWSNAPWNSLSPRPGGAVIERAVTTPISGEPFTNTHDAFTSHWDHVVRPFEYVGVKTRVGINEFVLYFCNTNELT